MSLTSPHHHVFKSPVSNSFAYCVLSHLVPVFHIPVVSVHMNNTLLTGITVHVQSSLQISVRNVRIRLCAVAINETVRAIT